jgi:hypothetical protein
MVTAKDAGISRLPTGYRSVSIGLYKKSLQYSGLKWMQGLEQGCKLPCLQPVSKVITEDFPVLKQ